MEKIHCESSFALVRRVQAGDAGAVDRLVLRYMPRLRRWIRHRLPLWARDVAETEDLVQEILVAALRNLPRFEMRNEMSLRAYMKQAARNRLADEIKRASRRPPVEELHDEAPSPAPLPLDQVIVREELWRCRVALARMPSKDRRLILLALSGVRNAKAFAVQADRPSTDAARMALRRAIRRLAIEMERLSA